MELMRRTRPAITNLGVLLKRKQTRCLVVAAGQPQAVFTTLGDLASESKPALIVNCRTSLKEVVRRIGDNNVSSLFVEDGGSVVGAIKETDIISHVNEQYNTDADFLQNSEAAQIMNKSVTYGDSAFSVRDSFPLLTTSKQDCLLLHFSGGEYNNELPNNNGVLTTGEIRLISFKQIIAQFYSDTVGISALDTVSSDDEREQLEAAASKALNLPIVKQLMKARWLDTEKTDGEEVEQMVLNAMVSDGISVLESIRRMTKYQKGSVALLDMVHDVPVLKGIVTEQDIVFRALYKELNLETTPIVDIMTSKNLATVSTKSSLLSCMRKIIRFNVRHLPVMSHKGSHILGVISSNDIISSLSGVGHSETA